jgi:hypothetical protein
VRAAFNEKRGRIGATGQRAVLTRVVCPARDLGLRNSSETANNTALQEVAIPSFAQAKEGIEEQVGKKRCISSQSRSGLATVE